MGFQVSPGVNIREIDLTTIVPAVASTAAGMAGVFRWGPCHERTLISNENELREAFGSPDNTTAAFFFTAANFLGYGNNLQVVRVVGSDAYNATPSGVSGQVFNQTHYDDNAATVFSAATEKFFARYPGAIGNNIAVYVQDGTATFTVGLTASAAVGATTVTAVNTSGTTIGLFAEEDDIITIDYGSNGKTTFNIASDVDVLISPSGGTANISLKTPVSRVTGIGNTAEVLHRYAQYFSRVPTTTASVNAVGGSNDEIHVAVVDYTGNITGIRGAVLETYESLSKSPVATKQNGENIYYKNVINRESNYIWAGDAAAQHISSQATGDNTTTYTLIDDGPGATAWGGSGSVPGVYYAEFSAGTDGTFSTNAAELWNKGYSEFDDPETVDVSLILGGPSNSTVQKLIIDMCDRRKDCIAFVSPVGTESSEYDIITNKTLGEQTDAVVNYRNNTLNKSSSYAVLDSGYKNMYDRYNDVYRNIPLNGDIAGLCARTEQEAEAWFSPAGFNRGQIRGVAKLPFNPKQTHRDNLYKNEVNPVVAFPGEGTILYGDKTLQSRPSAFDRINVRRLFIILEKAIATAAKFQLFEFNDSFTRNQFKNLVIPFLRDVQSRRGIFDFKVVCDESNNPASVIDRNEFVADIYIKPTRSINFIQLNFIATATGVNFEEIGG